MRAGVSLRSEIAETLRAGGQGDEGLEALSEVAIRLVSRSAGGEPLGPLALVATEEVAGALCCPLHVAAAMLASLAELHACECAGDISERLERALGRADRLDMARVDDQGDHPRHTLAVTIAAAGMARKALIPVADAARGLRALATAMAEAHAQAGLAEGPVRPPQGGGSRRRGRKRR